MQVLVDSSNSNTALISLGYIAQIGQRFAQNYAEDRMQRMASQALAFLPRVTLDLALVQCRTCEPVVFCARRYR